MALPGTPMGALFPIGGAIGAAQRRAIPQERSQLFEPFFGNFVAFFDHHFLFPRVLRKQNVAIVSQNSFGPVCMGYRTIIARYVAKWGIAQRCLCTKREGVIAPFNFWATETKFLDEFWGPLSLPAPLFCY